ncbi:MAG TPA: flagellin [Verrucomicrobiae bacterium]
MRITFSTFPNALVPQLGTLASRQAKLQTEAATGQRVQNASDDPVAMRRVLDLQAEAQSMGQYRKNVTRLQEVAGASFTAMRSLQKVSDRASEIATLADGLKSPEEMKIYAAEVNQLIQQAVQTANAKNRGDYIFAGTKNDLPPFTMALDANGQVTGVTYQGNDSVAESEIVPGQTIAVQPPGVNTSGSGPQGLLGDSRNGSDLFGHLISLRDNLLAGNAAGIVADHTNLAKDEDNLMQQYGLNGSIQSRLEVTAARIGDQLLSVESVVSQEVDADLAETLVKLNETQMAYQAALQSGASIMKMSLMDYLR